MGLFFHVGIIKMRIYMSSSRLRWRIFWPLFFFFHAGISEMRIYMYVWCWELNKKWCAVIISLSFWL